jgi:hypothetical protein
MKPGSLCLGCPYDSPLNSPLGACEVEDPVFCLNSKEFILHPIVKETIFSCLAYAIGRNLAKKFIPAPVGTQ